MRYGNINGIISGVTYNYGKEELKLAILYLFKWREDRRSGEASHHIALSYEGLTGKRQNGCG